MFWFFCFVILEKMSPVNSRPLIIQFMNAIGTYYRMMCNESCQRSWCRHKSRWFFKALVMPFAQDKHSNVLRTGDSRTSWYSGRLNNKIEEDNWSLIVSLKTNKSKFIQTRAYFIQKPYVKRVSLTILKKTINYLLIELGWRSTGEKNISFQFLSLNSLYII